MCAYLDSDEEVEQAETGGDDSEDVAGGNDLALAADKDGPTLRGRITGFTKPLLSSTLRLRRF